MNTLSPHPPAVRTTCPYCGVGCGILAAVDRQGDATISGDPAHPANFGRLCSKGSALGETLSLDQRLLHPMFRQADGSLARTDWDTALAKVANGLRTIVDRDGPNAIAFYLSGQLLTEDYYVANKLMKGFLGSSNVDTNSRLCMASSVAGHRRAFGADVVPGIYRDLDEADLIVLVGSNAAWCHPVLYQRMIAAKNERGTRLVVIDPRRTATADAADLFLPIASGMDTALFCGLLAYLADTRALNDSYIAEYTRGFADALARAREIAGDAAAEMERQLGECERPGRRCKDIDQDLEPLSRQFSHRCAKGAAFDYEKAAQRIRQLGLHNDAGQLARQTADQHPRFLPIADAPACGVAGADDDVEVLFLDRCQHPWEECFVMLQVGIHDCDERRRAGENPLDASGGQAAAPEPLNAADVAPPLPELAHQVGGPVW